MCIWGGDIKCSSHYRKQPSKNESHCPGGLADMCSSYLMALSVCEDQAMGLYSCIFPAEHPSFTLPLLPIWFLPHIAFPGNFVYILITEWLQKMTATYSAVTFLSHKWLVQSSPSGFLTKTDEKQ